MIYRIDVSPRDPGHDPDGRAASKLIAGAGLGEFKLTASRVFFIDSDAPADQIERLGRELLADPIVEKFQIVTSAAVDSDRRIEVHLKPGVMDPVAASTQIAATAMGIPSKAVRTGRAFVFNAALPRETLQSIASRVLANNVVESVFFEQHLPKSFAVAADHGFEIRSVALRNLNDDELKKLSRDGHLFLSLAEMKAVQDYYKQQGREPTDIELETLAQTWSEHCVHKTLKSAVEVVDESGKTLRTYKNLIKETIFNSTMELMKRRENNPLCLSVFKDNAGVIVFDDSDAVCFKVETHNRPSAIEPYGGAATGIGGCIRDILGTGLGARPVANSNVFCVAYPEKPAADLPKGVIHPRRILQQVVAGVRDYGNRMGIPTVNGAVYFDDNYVGNPLVFAGCVGIIPRDKITKEVRRGDAIVVMGGRTGRDGIHGATFSSAELTGTHADEFSHAVQIGNAITQKQLMDVLLQARDRGLYTAVTDCGAGGLSSAIGEMGGEIGAFVELEKVPLKYDGLRYDEIWISEAQERMVLSVPQDKVAQLLELSKSENVESTVIGTFGTEKDELILSYRGREVGRMAMHFMHDGIPMPTRRAVVSSVAASPVAVQSTSGDAGVAATENFRERLLKSLAHPNIASKHWIIRQYDHEVQGGSVIKPLIGPQQIGPSDAAVIRPKLTSTKGVIIANGLAPHVQDPYQMAIAAIDEAIRNAVCVGANLDQLAILDNFCWPGTDNEQAMGTLVRAAEACRDAALVFGVPFISGKDSLHNQFTDKEHGRVIKIPPTLLVSAIGVINDVRKCRTMDFKRVGSRVVLVRSPQPFDLTALNKLHRAMSDAVRAGVFSAVHDISDGGYATALAEMSIASGIGFTGHALPTDAFDEYPGGYIAELISEEAGVAMREGLKGNANVMEIGRTQADPRLTLGATDISIETLTAAWRGTLDW